MDAFPDDLLWHVLSFVAKENTDYVFSLLGVCRRWRHVSLSHMEALEFDGARLRRSKRKQKIARALLQNIIARSKRLQDIRLRNSAIRYEEAEILKKGLVGSSQLQVLDLEGNELRNKGMSVIADLLSSVHVLDLNVSKNHCGKDAALLICRAAASSGMTSIDLSENLIGVDGVQCIQELLKSNSSIRSIAARWNNFLDHGAIIIASEMLCNACLERLDLAHNRIQINGAQALGNAIAVHPSLRELDISHNILHPTGAKALCDALVDSQRLVSINLDNTGLYDGGALAVATLIKFSTSLKSVSLEQNSILLEGVESLAEALAASTTIEYLNLSNNVFKDEGCIPLAAALPHCKSLKFISLQQCGIESTGCALLRVSAGAVQMDLLNNKCGER
mmetsp:Transcript_14902/g.24722  ORF Transcript_14902/g.24722 Transcript_14902/m.24722 type:complete len:392 (+) Transcript_14902:66-1241(+)